MQGNPRLADLEAALDAIVDSRSAFEQQFHGLRLAELMVPNLTSTEAAQPKVITERALRSRRVRRDSDRRITGERILEALKDV